MDQESLKLIYQELVDARKQQQLDFDMIYNKFNWVIVSDIVLFGVLFSNDINIFSSLPAILLFASMLISLIFSRANNYKWGADFNELISAKNKKSIKLINALNNKISKAVEKNSEVSERFARYLGYSIFLLIFGVFLVPLPFIVDKL
jgi:hypothetical protein